MDWIWTYLLTLLGDNIGCTSPWIQMWPRAKLHTTSDTIFWHSLAFYMVWSNLLGVLSIKQSESFWLAVWDFRLVVTGANTPNKKSPHVREVELLRQKRVSGTVFIFVWGHKTLERCEWYNFFLSKGREGTHLLWRAAFLVYVVNMVARNPNALLGQAGHEVNLRLRDGSVLSENSDVVVLVPAHLRHPPDLRRHSTSKAQLS